VRRTEGGIRTWPAEPGEYYHSFDGSLWRAVAALGPGAQRALRHRLLEPGHCSWAIPIRQAPAARDNHHAWVFEGVKDELFGGYGYSGGGAAGFELDRLDHRLGSPLNAVVLASSEGHDRKELRRGARGAAGLQHDDHRARRWNS
jgi:N,N-dimethylformamidase